MIEGIRHAEAALGVPEKRLTSGEKSTREVARRSLVLSADLPAGTVLQRSHLSARRPGTGVSPMDLDRVLGRKLRLSKPKGSMISWADLE